MNNEGNFTTSIQNMGSPLPDHSSHIMSPMPANLQMIPPAIPSSMSSTGGPMNPAMSPTMSPMMSPVMEPTMSPAMSPTMSPMMNFMSPVESIMTHGYSQNPIQNYSSVQGGGKLSNLTSEYSDDFFFLVGGVKLAGARK